MAEVPKPEGRQGAFCDHYLAGTSAADAYRKAGYSHKAANTEGPKLLRNPRVAAWISQQQKKLARKAGFTAERVVKEIGLLAFSSVDHYSVDPNGIVGLTPGAPQSAMRAVSSIKKRFNADGTVEVELKLWDKPASLKMAGEYTKIFEAAKTPPNTTIVVVDPYAGEGKEPKT